MIQTPADREIIGFLEDSGIPVTLYDSQSHNQRAQGQTVDTLVIHYTAISLRQTLAIFIDPKREVSSHYTIDRRGGVHQTVSVSRRGWHSGRSELKGVPDVNGRSVGIDLVFIPTKDDGFTTSQMDTLKILVTALRAQFPIEPDGIIGHEHVAIPAGRKADPGPLFDWEGLYRSQELPYPPGFLEFS